MRNSREIDKTFFKKKYNQCAERDKMELYIVIIYNQKRKTSRWQCWEEET